MHTGGRPCEDEGRDPSSCDMSTNQETQKIAGKIPEARRGVGQILPCSFREEATLLTQRPQTPCLQKYETGSIAV